VARLAAGRADDLLTTLVLATEAPVGVAPAMNRIMWSKSVTQANVAALRERGVEFFGPGEGEQACGEVGSGRMLEPAQIAAQLAASLGDQTRMAASLSGATPVDVSRTAHRGLLSGRRVLVTAGPTRERIDPVRFISNRSSGKMGFAVAEAASAAGADVVLVAGPVSLDTPPGVRRVDVESAADMLAVVERECVGLDVFIGTAAVADYRPVLSASHKIKKTAERIELALERTTDILATVAARPDRPFSVGFAAETHDVESYARGKLLAKRLDLIAANEVGDDKVFDKDENTLLVLWADGQLQIGPACKTVVAERLVELIATRLRFTRTS
jgi:phosphopantothenoylcysteine decarboxylase/phosphopantothenate--cysteine ligase